MKPSADPVSRTCRGDRGDFVLRNELPHTTNRICVVLIVVVHIPIVEIHIPSVIGII